MSEDRYSGSDEERIDREAAEWLAEESAGMDGVRRRKYEAWLKQDDRHRQAIEAYQDMRSGFRALLPEEGEQRPRPDLLAPREPGKTVKAWVWPASITALAACLALAFVIANLLWRDVADKPSLAFIADFSASEFERHFLPDGTLLELREGAALDVRYNGARRAVTLLSGEAHFSVTRDPLRPFLVEAGGAAIRALGTAFNVRVSHEEVELLVTEGVVAVEEAASQRSPRRAASRLLIEQTLQASEKVTIHFRGDLAKLSPIERVPHSDLEKRLFWKHETLKFEGTPLDEAVREFNLRNRDQIVIADEALAEERIDGLFRSDNLAAFVELLEISGSARAERDQAGRIVLRRKAN